jgi:hypothetical protein
MKTIVTHISLILLAMTAAAQGPLAPRDLDPEAIVKEHRISFEPVESEATFPEAAEYAFSVGTDAGNRRIVVHVNAAPGIAHARIIDSGGNLLYFAPEMEIDRTYHFPELEEGSYRLLLDTEEGLPAREFKVTLH